MTKHKIIFDTDPGVDDTMAILFAHACPEIDLLGMTTVFGNGTIENVTRNALFVKQKFGLTADVAKGAGQPLVRELHPPPTFIHGQNALGDIDIPDKDYGQPDPRPAHDYIIDTLKAHPQEITIVGVASLTNLALALQKEPSIIKLAKEVVLMGGAFGYNGHAGNVTPFAEANIICDPHAADMVLTSNWQVTMVGLDVTHQSVMSDDYMEVLRQNSKEYGQFVYDISRLYSDFYKRERNALGFCVHDFSALAYLIAPELFTIQEGPIRVVKEGVAVGHTMLKKDQRRYAIDEWSDQPSQKICTQVDNEKLLELYMHTLCQ